MLAERLPTIMPSLEPAAGGELGSLGGRSAAAGPAAGDRAAVCAPHHTATKAAIVGGGSGIIRPGAASPPREDGWQRPGVGSFRYRGHILAFTGFELNRSCISASLVVSGVLVLSACGASKPAQTTAPSSTSPAAGPTATNPTAASPAGGGSVAASTRIGPYTQIFATPLPTSPAKARVIRRFEMAEILWARSEYAGHRVPPVTKYVTGQALTHLMTAMSSLKANEVVPAGTDRLFMTSVTALTSTTATVITCDDGSKYAAENAVSGKADPAYSPSANEKYLFETWHMVLLSGRWAISSFTLDTLPSASAQHCQP